MRAKVRHKASPISNCEKVQCWSTDEHLEKKLYDARGIYRGALTGKGWDDFGKEKVLLLDAYQPNPLPMPQDWVLVLESGK